MGIGKRVSSEPDETSGDSLVNTYDVSLSDLIVPDSTRAALDDFLAYRKHEDLIFDRWGLINTHSRNRQTAINFYGPPGTGKTMAAYAISQELSQPLLMINYSELESKYVGETSKNITSIFQGAKKNNSIIFFDEADAILSRRVTDMTHATDVSVNQTRSVLLMLMNQHDGLIIFTTNFIENYDPAFMRRILAHVKFELPDLECREKLWRKYIPSDYPLNVEIDVLAIQSDGLSGSDISSCVLKAALSAARQGLSEVNLNQFQAAINEIKNSKAENSKVRSWPKTNVSERIVSEDYVMEKIG